MTLNLLSNFAARAVLDLSDGPAEDGDAREFHKRLPGYTPTPLVDAPALADVLGVARVLVKDESSRIGLPSYKVLGASWAIYRELLQVLSLDPGDWRDVGDLARLLVPYGPLRLVTATDGNHGRAVARVARLLGLSATIYVPDDMARARIDGIASEGARVEVVNGSYDQAVARSAQDAAPDVLVISDTSWPGYERVPGWVMQGYSTIFTEVAEQTAARGLPQPTTVAVQIGVGALAAATVRAYRTGAVLPSPTIVGVEPVDAACMLASIEAGKITEVARPHRSIMAGLNCGLASPLAFPLVRQGIDVFLALDDDDARQAMRTLAAAGVESGESGAAGFAGLAAAKRAGRGAEVGLDADAVVLVVSTEGATDPVGYARIVGSAPGPRPA